tara:strand:- start:2120 stop:3043 length:924 start_codon:yes stop_codon:yes gene_type:complete
MSITAADVKALREKTGAGMMDCKKALTKVGGDQDKAVEYLRKQGLASAGKKAGRIAAEGAVVAEINADAKIGALLEVNCETDFVGKTDDFQNLAKSLTELVRDHNPADNSEFLALNFGTGTVDNLVQASIAKIGEKITPRRFVRYEVKNGVVHSYIHGGGSIGVLLALEVSNDSVTSNDKFKELYADLAMHIAAAAPTYLNREEVPSTETDKEIDIYKEQLRKEGKPEGMLEKISQGKLNKYYQEVCLLEQPFVKETKLKIKQLLQNVGKEIGAEISIPSFSRFVLGEGIEKKQEDFAAEVAAAVQV